MLEAVFILLEPLSPSRRFFIDSHSLPPFWFAVSVLQRRAPCPMLCPYHDFVVALARTNRLHHDAPVLTVKSRQRSDGFTFGVGMSFVPYPLVLTPLV
jgi:hypothetical protein